MQLDDYPNTTFCFVIKRERERPRLDAANLDDEADLFPPPLPPAEAKS